MKFILTATEHMESEILPVYLYNKTERVSWRFYVINVNDLVKLGIIIAQYASYIADSIHC